MKVLVTGGAGFIGTNAAKYFSKQGYQVTIFDNLSRKGSKYNLKNILEEFSKTEFVKGDVKNSKILEKVVKGKDVVLHLAGQVAVTSSVLDPIHDFKNNLLGTINVLEAIRKNNPQAILIYSSTNKVYGGMENEKVKETKTRYEYKGLKQGISEDYPIDFHSPYGCSKGAGDQYVRDYSRIYGLKTIVFRQSCIYGYNQFGVEDQGWIAHFLIALMTGKKITIYGNGKQVRDILFIDDLVRAYDLAIKNINKTKGQIYNIGGGLKSSISIFAEFSKILEKLFDKEIKADFKDWRPGDQKIYISDIKKAKKDFNWKPQVMPQEGINKLYNWVYENRASIHKILSK